MADFKPFFISFNILCSKIFNICSFVKLFNLLCHSLVYVTNSLTNLLSDMRPKNKQIRNRMLPAVF